MGQENDFEELSYLALSRLAGQIHWESGGTGLVLHDKVTLPNSNS